MPIQWNHYNPVNIHFRQGSLSELPKFVDTSRSLLVTTPGFNHRGLIDRIQTVSGAPLNSIYASVTPNPSFSSIKRAYENIRTMTYDTIIAVGGGSTIDTAKAIAALTEIGNIEWLKEHLKHGKPLPSAFHPTPLIAVPTTSGTGSEVTMWATIWGLDEKLKYSLSHPALYPKTALLDPDLTISLPKNETLHSGLDALSHAMESIWNKKHNPISDNLALAAISLIFDYLPLLIDSPANPYFRTKLHEASLLSGLAFSNTQTALAHSISYPLTIHYALPHGLACSITLPKILKFNGFYYPERIKIMASVLKTEPNIEALETCLQSWFQKLSVSTELKSYGVPVRATKTIIETALSSGRAGNNIKEIDQQDLAQLVDTLY